MVDLESEVMRGPLGVKFYLYVAEILTFNLLLIDLIRTDGLNW